MPMADLDPFTRKELEILLQLVGDRDVAIILGEATSREQVADLEKKLASQLSIADFSRAIAEDIRLGRTSQQISDEIIAKVGMMADARTPEMQARYDAAVARESGNKNTDPILSITIAGTRPDEATIVARAVLELLQEAGIRGAMPEEAENPFDGDSIEQLGHLRGVGRVIVQTSGVP